MVSLVSRLKGSAILRLSFLSPSSSFGRRSPTMSAAMSTVTSININSPADEPLTSSKPGPSPWLMLPPKAGDTLVCNFYNLAEDRVESFGVELPDSNDAVLVGSSHGWLAFFNRRNNHVFLSNPLSGRLLKLPSIDALLDYEMNLRGGRGTVSKLILSSSPERDDCRAMISFGPGHRPAFCSPGCSSTTHWTSLGDWLYENKKLFPDGPAKYTDARTYEDLVYNSILRKFNFITEFQIAHDSGELSRPTRLEEHRLHGLPQMVAYCLGPLMSTEDGLGDRGFSWMSKAEGEKSLSWLKENKTLLESCVQIPYLLFNEQCDGLYIMTRFLNAGPYKTIGFLVLKLEYKNEGFPAKLRVVDSLDGLALFVGLNHSFAVSSPAEFGLKPNSIYFTDAANARVMPPAINGHDNGIFDYGNKTLSPCPGPDYDDAQTLSTPVWFTPSPY
ncbi:hypothetical protein CASFOL_005704 [Castilleja foliolosa]|uniref:KIB1-4 beta-propeller domain-containing protein n=1 Tax=Castilleja foliolosa TaxID=1961234 RepID=A0ABD3E892_9LAMI